MRPTWKKVPAIACCLLWMVPARAQTPFPPIPGTNIGFNPNAFVAPMSIGSQFGIAILNPGSDFIMSFHDPATLPVGTNVVTLNLGLWAVLEPNACASGTGLFFDTQNPIAISPVASVATTGWNLLTAPWSFRYVRDPFHSSWQLTYCSVSACTSPCGPSLHDPLWEAYFVTL